MALAPKVKFLYHVYFSLNTEIPALRSLFPRTTQSQIGLMVKSIQLPSFDVQTESLNQYNRTRIVQTGIKYQPVTITFHDDGRDVVRSLWRQYYRYYFGDSQARPSETGRRDIYNQSRRDAAWGYLGEPYSGSAAPGVKPPFFTDIQVYGFNQKNNVGYKLINPTIKSWQHDTYDYSEAAGIMEHTASVEYEAVEYLGNQSFVPGFAEPGGYDRFPSPLGKPGANSSLFGPGGLFDSIGDVATDLASGNVLGALLGAARTANAAKQISKAGSEDEVKAIVNGVLRGVSGIPR